MNRDRVQRGQLTRFGLVNFPLADSHCMTVAVEAFVCHKYLSQSIIVKLSLLRTVIKMILRIPNIGRAYQCKHLAGREGGGQKSNFLNFIIFNFLLIHTGLESKGEDQIPVRSISFSSCCTLHYYYLNPSYFVLDFTAVRG